MSDLIDRQAVLEQINGWLDCQLKNMTNPIYDSIYYLENRIKDLPSVTQTERTGHWIEENHDEYVLWRCSECGARTELDMTEGYGCGWKYCPICGARLRGDAE